MNSGFTLVELLVTIAIVGILSAISVAQFNSFKQKAYYAEMLSLKRDLQNAAEALISECSLANCKINYDIRKSFQSEPYVDTNGGIFSDLINGMAYLERNLTFFIDAEKFDTGIETRYIFIRHCLITEPNINSMECMSNSSTTNGLFCDEFSDSGDILGMC